jgi:hypothetical protein
VGAVVVVDVVVVDDVAAPAVVEVVGSLVAGADVVDSSTVVLVRISWMAESSPDPQAAAPESRTASTEPPRRRPRSYNGPLLMTAPCLAPRRIGAAEPRTTEHATRPRSRAAGWPGPSQESG